MTRWWHPTHPLQLLCGLLLWSVWFVVLYAAQALHCLSPAASATWHPTGFNVALLMAGAVLTGALTGLMWRCMRAARQAGLPLTARFIALASAVLHGTAAFSTLFVSLPLWGLPPCL